MNNVDFLVPLFVTCSFNPPGNPCSSAKALASSLLRSLFGGVQNIYHNCDAPIFRISRQHLNENSINIYLSRKQQTPATEAKWNFLNNLAKIINVEPRQWVIVSHAASLALRNIDHLIPKDSMPLSGAPGVDIYWAKAASGDGGCQSDLASPGIWAVRGEYLSIIMEKWYEIWCKEHKYRTEEEIWTKVIMTIPLRKQAFEKGEIYAPRIGAVNWEALTAAAFVTVPGWPEKEQWKFLQSLYFGTYFGDDTGLMLNILEP